MNPLQKLASSTYRGANRIGKSVGDEFAPAGAVFKDMMAPRTPSVHTPTTSGVQPVTSLRDSLSGRGGALGGMMKHYQNIQSYKKGGTVKKTGLAYLHKGETVVTKEKSKALMKKMDVRHEPSMEFSPSTSYSGGKGADRKTFKTSEGRYKDFVKGWNDPGYQKHLTDRERRRGE